MTDYQKCLNKCTQDLIIENLMGIARVELAIVRKQPEVYEEMAKTVKISRSFDKKIKYLHTFTFLQEPIKNMLNIAGITGPSF